MNAAKRKAIIVSITEEMANCIPDPSNRFDSQEEDLGDALNRFLDLAQTGREGILFFNLLWDRQLALKFHVLHGGAFSLSY